MKNTNIGFIGGGNMATSLIGGLIAGGVSEQKIWVADPRSDQLERLKSHFSIHTSKNNDDIAQSVDVIVFAVKPQVMKTVAVGLADSVQKRKPLIITITAGIRGTDLSRWLGQNLPIVRSMPNTPALVQSGATALFANSHVTLEQRDLAESIMRAVGLTLWVADEGMMDAVTALSGSGPAYFFLIMEALEQAGQKLGLPKDTARLLTLQTAFGAAKMALESSEDVDTLRRYVTSPGGTTERAVNVLQDGHIQDLFTKALNAAYQRSIELAEKLGKE